MKKQKDKPSSKRLAGVEHVLLELDSYHMSFVSSTTCFIFIGPDKRQPSV